MKYPGGNETHLLGRFYSVNHGSSLASWNTTVVLKEDCDCPVVKTDKVFGFFGDYVSTGALEVDLGGASVVSLDNLNKTAPMFLTKVDERVKEQNATSKWSRYCYNSIGFSGLLKKLTGMLMG